MRPSTSRACTLFATVLILSPAAAGAATIVNGDFSDAQDFAGWQPTGDVLHEPGGAFGQLETDGTFQRTLQQGFLVVGHHYRLSFDFAFSTQATTPPGAGVADAFAVSIVTAGGDYLDILAADVVGAVPDPSDGNEAANNAVPIQVGLDPSVTISGFLPFVGGAAYTGRITLDLPDLVLGQDATLFFDLFDYPDGSSTIAAVDNVTLEPFADLPLPTTVALLLPGLLAAPLVRRRSPSVTAKHPPESLAAKP